MNYNEADRQLVGRCQESRKLENNTYLRRRDDGVIAVRLHNTDVITFFEGGPTVLNTGGWKTVTTKDRMNKHADGVSIRQRDGVWYVTTAKTRSCIYYDGMHIFKGKVQNPPGVCKSEAKQVERYKKQINGFCKELKGLDKLPTPNGGDCWYCLMFDKNNGAGKIPNNVTHVMEHLKERYIHGSLLVNALKFVGYRDEQVAFVWSMRDIVVRATRRYLKRCAGMAA